MARARNIKPGFYKNEQLAECSIWARYIFPGLWMLADREGRLEDRPKRIKAELLPFDTQDAEPLLDELHKAKLILRYEHAGERYIQVLAFAEHQHPHQKEPPSTIPEPGAEPVSHDPKAPDKTEAKPGPARPITESLISESGEKALSGAAHQDGVDKSETTATAKARAAATAAAHEAIDYLNAKAGTKYRHSKADLKFAIDRQLIDKASLADLKAVVDAKVAEAAAGKFDRKYLRPETLWNATKFGSYIGQVGAASASHLASVKTIHVAVDLRAGGGRRSIAEYTWASSDFNAFELVLRTARNGEHRQMLLAPDVEAVIVYVDKEQGLKGRWSVAEVKEGLRKAA